MDRPQPGARRVPAWDAPVRLFHWALAVLVVFSYATGKVGGEWLPWHMRSGYAILALLLFRIGWGLVGSPSARFATFLRTPVEAARYLRDTALGRARRFPGHNPAGAWMVVFLLAVLLGQAISGLFVDDEIATRGPLAVKASGAVVARMTWIHSWNEWLIVAGVALHVAAIAFYQAYLRVDLVGPMLHGRVAPDAPVPPPPASNALGAVLFAIACAVVYWLVMVYPRTAP